MRIALLATFIFMTLSGWAADPNCPASLVVEETLKQGHEGWTQGRADLPQRLSGITIFEGDPKELVSLIGEQRKTSKNTTVSTWQFTRGTQYWISCTYSGTRIVLSRPIPFNCFSSSRTIWTCPSTGRLRSRKPSGEPHHRLTGNHPRQLRGRRRVHTTAIYSISPSR